jgi:transposase
MGAPLQILRTDHTSGELRALSNRCPDGAQVRRILALAMILDGRSRAEAAQMNGMDRQTLRDWVHRYNVCGVRGLKSRRKPGRAPLLTQMQKAELLDLVLAGPDPERHGVVRWRCVDLQAEVERRFSVKVHVNTIGVWLHKLGLTRLQPRPVHPKKDPEAEAIFKKTLSAWSKPLSSEPRLSARWKSGSRTKPALVRKADTPISGRRSVRVP